MSLDVGGEGSLQRLAMLGGQEVDLDVVIDEALERDPAGSDAQGVTDALGDHHLALRSYHIRHGITFLR